MKSGLTSDWLLNPINVLMKFIDQCFCGNLLHIFLVLFAEVRWLSVKQHKVTEVLLLNICRQFEFLISQGSVATCLR